MSRDFTILTCDQRTPEWYAARLGRLTGSRASDAMATIKSGEAASRRNYRLQLVLERLTGKSQDSGFQSEAMKQGIVREDGALRVYEAHTGRIFVRTGFVQHATLMAGVSLDGHVGDFEGIVDVKCPQPPAHLRFLQSETIPHDYKLQLLHGMWITGADWGEMASYNPDFPEGLGFKIVRIDRDQAQIDAYALAASLFLSEVDREVEAVLKLMEVPA